MAEAGTTSTRKFAWVGTVYISFVLWRSGCLISSCGSVVMRVSWV